MALGTISALYSTVPAIISGIKIYIDGIEDTGATTISDALSSTIQSTANLQVGARNGTIPFNGNNRRSPHLQSSLKPRRNQRHLQHRIIPLIPQLHQPRRRRLTPTPPTPRTRCNINQTETRNNNILSDTTPPAITIQSPANTTYPASSTWFNTTLSEQGSSCAYSLDSAPNSTMTNQSGNYNAPKHIYVPSAPTL